MDFSTRRETFGQGDQTWLASAHATDTARSVTIDVRTFTQADHYPDGYLKSGLPLGRITNATENGRPVKRFGLYSDSATDGRQTLVGFLFEPLRVPQPTSTPAIGSMLVHCFIDDAKLPVAVDANGRADVAGRIIFVP